MGLICSRPNPDVKNIKGAIRILENQVDQFFLLIDYDSSTNANNIVRLFTALRNNHTIEYLTIMASHLDIGRTRNRLIACLVDALCYNKTLRSLNLYGWTITDDEMFFFAVMLRENKTLISMQFSSSMDFNGLTALVSAMQVNCTLCSAEFKYRLFCRPPSLEYLDSYAELRKQLSINNKLRPFKTQRDAIQQFLKQRRVYERGITWLVMDAVYGCNSDAIRKARRCLYTEATRS